MKVKSIIILLMLVFSLTSCQNNKSSLPDEYTKEVDTETDQQEEIDTENEDNISNNDKEVSYQGDSTEINDDNLESDKLTIFEEYQSLNEEEKWSFERKLIDNSKEKHGYSNGVMYKFNQNDIQILLYNDEINELIDCKAYIIDYKSNEVIKAIYLDSSIINNEIYIYNSNSYKDKYYLVMIYSYNEENEIMYSKLAFINKKDEELKLEILREYELKNPQGIIPTIIEFSLNLVDDYLIFHDTDMYWKIIDLMTKEIFSSNETVSKYSEYTRLDEKLGKYVNILKFTETDEILAFNTEEKEFAKLDRKDMGFFNLDIDKVGNKILNFTIAEIDDRRETGFEKVKFEGEVTLKGELCYYEEAFSLILNRKEIENILPMSAYLYDLVKEKDFFIIDINNEEFLKKSIGEEIFNRLKENLDSKCSIVAKFDNYVSLLRYASSSGHNADLVELISFDEVKMKVDPICQKFLDAKEKDEKILSKLKNPDDWFITETYYDSVHYIAINKINNDVQLINGNDYSYLGDFNAYPYLEYKKSYFNVNKVNYYYSRENKILYTFDENNISKVVLDEIGYIDSICIGENYFYILIRDNKDGVIKKITNDGNKIDIARGNIRNMKLLENGDITYISNVNDKDTIIRLNINENTNDVMIKMNGTIGEYDVVDNKVFILNNKKIIRYSEGKIVEFKHNRAIQRFFIDDKTIFFNSGYFPRDIYKIDINFENLEFIYNDIEEKAATIVGDRIISKVEAGEAYCDIKTIKDDNKVEFKGYDRLNRDVLHDKHLLSAFNNSILYVDCNRDNKLIIDDIDFNNPQTLVNESIKWYEVFGDNIFYISYSDNNLYLLDVDTNNKEMLIENLHYFTKQNDMIIYIPLFEQDSLNIFDLKTRKSKKILNEVIEQVILLNNKLFYIPTDDNCLYVLNLEDNTNNQITKEPVKLIRQNNNNLYVYHQLGIYEIDQETNKLLFHHFNDLSTRDILFNNEMMYSITATDDASYYVEKDTIEYNSNLETDYEYNDIEYVARKYWVKMGYLFSFNQNTRELIKVVDVVFDEMIPYENTIYLLNSYDTAFIAAYDLDSQTLSYIEEPIMDWCKYKAEIIDGELVYELIKH